MDDVQLLAEGYTAGMIAGFVRRLFFPVFVALWNVDLDNPAGIYFQLQPPPGTVPSLDASPRYVPTQTQCPSHSP